MIIFEGIDGSGKSTLANYCASHLNFIFNPPYSVQGSEGPAKSREEIHERIAHYFKMKNVLFDRHPAISQPIYNTTRDTLNVIAIDQAVVADLYRQKNLIIYCDPLNRSPLDNHTPNPNDTPQHLSNIKHNYYRLLVEYRSWAIKHAHIVYRIGDSMKFIARLVANNVLDHT